MSREPLEADRWASAFADGRHEGGQRLNGAQTVEPRARSGGTVHYSDGTDAPRAPIVPNTSYAAVVARPKAPPPRFGECFCKRSPRGGTASERRTISRSPRLERRGQSLQ